MTTRIPRLQYTGASSSVFSAVLGVTSTGGFAPFASRSTHDPWASSTWNAPRPSGWHDWEAEWHRQMEVAAGFHAPISDVQMTQISPYGESGDDALAAEGRPGRVVSETRTTERLPGVTIITTVTEYGDGSVMTLEVTIYSPTPEIADSYLGWFYPENPDSSGPTSIPDQPWPSEPFAATGDMTRGAMPAMAPIGPGGAPLAVDLMGQHEDIASQTTKPSGFGDPFFADLDAFVGALGPLLGGSPAFAAPPATTSGVASDIPTAMPLATPTRISPPFPLGTEPLLDVDTPTSMAGAERVRIAEEVREGPGGDPLNPPQRQAYNDQVIATIDELISRSPSFRERLQEANQMLREGGHWLTVEIWTHIPPQEREGRYVDPLGDVHPFEGGRQMTLSELQALIEGNQPLQGAVSDITVRIDATAVQSPDVLAHEMEHAFGMATGEFAFGNTMMENRSGQWGTMARDEERATGIGEFAGTRFSENVYMVEAGYWEAPKDSYGAGRGGWYPIPAVQVHRQ